MLRNIVILFSVAGFFAAIYNGLARDFSMYNYSGIVASLITFFSALISKLEVSKKKDKTHKMEQSVSHNSSGIQVGGSINIYSKDESK